MTPDGWGAGADAFLRALTFRAGYNTGVVVAGVGALGVACGLVGAFTLLRRRALLSDALSHAGLPGVCAAYLAATALGMSGKSLPILLAGAVLFGAAAVACVRLLALVPRWKQDAAIGATLSVFFAFGVVLLSYIQSMATGDRAGLQAFIFGQAAALSRQDAVLTGACALGVALVVVLAFKELRITCFDPAFAASIGWRVEAIDALLLTMVVIATALGLQAVGIVLIIALLITPAAAARLWTERLPAMLALSAGIGGASAYVGASISAAAPRLPTGAVIVCVCGVMFVLSLLFAPARGLIAASIRRAALGRIIATQRALRAMYEREEAGLPHTSPADLVAVRSWSMGRARALLRRAERRGDAERVRPDERPSPGWRLTPRGRERAIRATRNHRLWEMYLIRFADVAPTHVDRSADDVEAILGPQLVATLEAALAEEALARPLPTSPHAIPLPARQAPEGIGAPAGAAP